MPASFKGETGKAHERRLATGWYDKYAPADKNGIDIGCQNDPIHPHFDKWDYIFGNGDATLMEGVEGNTYHTVYCSHVLEHIKDTQLAIKNWFRILAPGGCLTIVVPHRDLYEGRVCLPSIWNLDHKWFWLPAKEEKDTKSLLKEVQQALPHTAFIVDFQLMKEGWFAPAHGQHPPGEYSISITIRKGPPKVVVLGDSMLNKHYYGTPTRLAHEAPVPVISNVVESFSLGGAGSMASCCAKLWMETTLVSAVGFDENGKLLDQECGYSDFNYLQARLYACQGRTATRSRIYAYGGAVPQCVARMDEEMSSHVPMSRKGDMYGEISIMIQEADCCVVVDHGKGFVNERLMECVKDNATGPVFIDTRRTTPPLYKANTILVGSIKELPPWVWRDRLGLAPLDGQFIIEKKGEDGSVLHTASGHHVQPPFPGLAVNTLGAGDQYLAAVVYGTMAAWPFRRSVALGAVAASIRCCHPEAVEATTQSLLEKWTETDEFSSSH